MAKIKAALHEHLRTGSGLGERDFDKTIFTADYRLGHQSMFGVVDFDDKRYKRFIELPGMDRAYVGDDKRAIRLRDKGDVWDISCVHGEEVPTKQGHLLVLGLGYEAHLKHGRDVEETIREARDYNPEAVIIVDHPFHRSGLGNHLKENLRLLEEIDAIETFNGEASFGIFPFPAFANFKARSFYRKNNGKVENLGAISTSDGHSFFEFGRSNVMIEKPDFSSTENFSKTFRQGVRDTCLSAINRKSYITGNIGAIKHIAEMVGIIAGCKLGFEDYFNRGIERPDNK